MIHIKYISERLMKSGNYGKTGTWNIIGEDPNCDFGGHHYQPNLGYFTGKFEDIVDLAFTLPGFITWGHGGDIEEVKVQVVNQNTSKEKADLRARISELRKELDQIEKQLEEKHSLP